MRRAMGCGLWAVGYRLRLVSSFGSRVSRPCGPLLTTGHWPLATALWALGFGLWGLGAGHWPATAAEQKCSVALFAFSEEGEGQRIWLVQGEDVKRYEAPEPTVLLSWSPDGKLLAYCPLDQPGRVKVKAASGGGEATLDRKLGARGNLWWSPGGDQIAFLDDGSVIADPNTQEEPGSASAGGLSVVDVKRGRPRRILHNPEQPGDPITRAAWSPDGKWLAALDEGGGLLVIRPDGTGQKFCERLTTGFGWQPDSKGLVVTGASFLGWRGIAVWRPEEGTLDIVLGENGEMSSEEFGEPCLSPRGDELAFSYEARLKDTGKRQPVSVCCLDLKSKQVVVVAASEGGCWSPRFLPDGRIAFLSGDDPAFAWVIAERAEAADVDGSGRRTLAMVPGELFHSLAIVPY